ncbi:polysaccharide biosynthesis/export family protein [Sphingomonas bacterium]|uniref:polysaccharide biosynthesis/export family protein n=1 Tax=Sphingomonas bacterium TaxID=1895847 RepID=UPI001574F3B0|nr:polysaccharide biosynthesis/export family protein [Sphingomonas bacterium]
MINRLRHGAIAAGVAITLTAAQAPPAMTGPNPTTYTLGPGDKVRVIVYGEDALSGEYNVTSAGEISFPLIGNVAATGASTVSLQALIRDRLMRGYIKDPRVSIEVLDYRPFFILGEVAKPGQYPYANGMTVQQAVATAGGYTYRASTRKIYIKHQADMAETAVDLRKREPVPVQPGDVLRVAERFF